MPNDPDQNQDARFGDRFEVKGENRMDVLRKSDNPAYIDYSRDVRKLLREALKQNGWPVMPKGITSVEAFLENAKTAVTKEWITLVYPKLMPRCAEWAAELKKGGGDEAITRLLEDPDTLEQKLAIRQFGVLESLRLTLPNAWRELVIISSERQLASVALTRHWLMEIDENQRQSFARDIGLKTVEELEILLDAAVLLGKYIDHVYVKQIELADKPGGSTATKLAKESTGSKYVYDVYRALGTNDVDVKSYSEVFPFEWKKIGQSLHRLADKVEQYLADWKLPEEYKNFPAYARGMARTYLSGTKDMDLLYKEWQSLFQQMRELIKEGCPLMLVPQATPSVAGDANKVDVEVRLGFRTKEAMELEKTLEGFRALTGDLLKEEKPFMEEEYVVPPVFVNFQPFAFGPNLYWTTRGESGKKQIVAHTNAVIDVAVTTALPAFRSMFTTPVEEGAFNRATLIDNSLHELGHFSVHKDDARVRERVGVSSDVIIVDEMKADTVDMLLVDQAKTSGKFKEVDFRMQFIAKLADACDYLKNKSRTGSGERYFYDGVGIIHCLFDQGIIVEDGDKYAITEPEKGIEALANIGREIRTLYMKGTEEELHAFVHTRREQEREPRTAKFIAQLKM